MNRSCNQQAKETKVEQVFLKHYFIFECGLPLLKKTLQKFACVWGVMKASVKMDFDSVDSQGSTVDQADVFYWST